MPADLKPADTGDADKGPPAEIDVFTGGNIRWADVTVPKGLEVVDQRLGGPRIHDGRWSRARGQGLRPGHASARRRKHETRAHRDPDQGWLSLHREGRDVCGPDGRWVLKKSPAGWYRVVVEADGYVPRIVGYAQFDEQPLWQSYECGIAPAAAVSGRVTDDAGKPLEGVEVRLSDVVPVVADGMNPLMGIAPRPMPTAAFITIGSRRGTPASGCIRRTIVAQG